MAEKVVEDAAESVVGDVAEKVLAGAVVNDFFFKVGF